MSKPISDPLARHLNNNVDSLVDTLINDGIALAISVLLLLSKLIWDEILVSLEISIIVTFFIGLSFCRTYKLIKDLNGSNLEHK